MGEGRGKLPCDVTFKFFLLCEEAEAARAVRARGGVRGQQLRTEGGDRDVGARDVLDVDLIPELTKDIGADTCVARKECVANAACVTVGGTTTHDRANGVGAEGLESNDTVRVHGEGKVAEVAGTGMGEARE